MFPAMEIIAGRTTGDTTSNTAVTVNTGNSLTVRNAPYESDVYLLTLFTHFQAAGTGVLRSARLHDNVRGIGWSVPATDGQLIVSPNVPQKLYPQDTLVLETDGGAAAGDVSVTALILYYMNLPGINARLFNTDYIRQHGVNVVTVTNTISTTATGDWGGEEAINAEVDLLRANTDYALIGYRVSAACAAVRWRGVDTGNLGVGGPGATTNQNMTSQFFAYLSDQSGLPCIPVFNSANKSGILVDASQDESGTDITVTSILVELK